MTKLYSGIVVALASLLLFNSSAQAETRNYQVEVLIFSNLTSDTLDDEIWPTIDAVPALRSRKLTYYQQGQPINYFTRLPKSSLQMGGKQASLRRSPDYRVLFHEAWVQPIGEIKDQNRVRITGGDILDNGLYELDGYISIDKARYLHFRTNLFHSRQLSATETRLLLQATTKPDSQNLTEGDNLTAASSDNEAMTDDESANGNRYLTQTAIPDFLTTNLTSGRRMRSNELHYLDHPLFGVLVQMTPTE
ncbi:CsiV family protein [Amphritea balenae]|uniref:Peptidoglycan-binding protein CsiV n=1 Tax=Amphritea balenae TaxID=452629 RepID=A0A3P1SU83_9GAMM|nr:CsiV family protein [Amphritea balenae]RRD00650.1 hypothetical protein EHS89_06085 [Amphritea balenae]GGK69016.1 hypothetical protein GCM10007941_18950 [Amphritea balenae]